MHRSPDARALPAGYMQQYFNPDEASIANQKLANKRLDARISLLALLST
jgi:hypothetical protein